jgi:soluble lytic murein transglycosylase-like protein
MRAAIRLSVLVLALAAGAPPYAAPDGEPDPALKALLKEAAKAPGSFGDRFDAEVWLMDMSYRLGERMPNNAERVEFLKTLHAEASRAGLTPELVLAVVEVESNFDRFAISRAGARGLMQIMPFWLNEIGRPEDNLFQISTNLRYGCTILRYYLDMEQGHLARALARYNGSTGRWDYPILVFNALDQRWYRN